MRARAFLSALLLMTGATSGVSQQRAAAEGGNVVPISGGAHKTLTSPKRGSLHSSGQCGS